MERYYKKWFTILTLPAIIVFALVIVAPFVAGVLYSFTGWRGTYFVQIVDGITQKVDHFWQAFVGLRNYANAFRIEEFKASMLYTLEFTVIAIIIINLVSLAMALLVTKITKGAGLYRGIYFLPNLLGGLTLGFIWSFIYEIIFSQLLFGPDGIIPIDALCNMTQDSTKTLFALAFLSTWQMAGYMMMIYVNGLNNIPKDVYEAASIDGATGIKSFFKVTLPLLMPSVTIVFFLTLANCFKMLDQNVALTNGNFNTRLLALQILNTTQDYTPPNYGLAQAQAVIFFVLIATVSLIQLSITKKREVEA